MGRGMGGLGSLLVLSLLHLGVCVTPGCAHRGKKTMKVPPIFLDMVLGMGVLANHRVQITGAVVGGQGLVRRVF